MECGAQRPPRSTGAELQWTGQRVFWSTRPKRVCGSAFASGTAFYHPPGASDSHWGVGGALRAVTESIAIILPPRCIPGRSRVADEEREIAVLDERQEVEPYAADRELCMRAADGDRAAAEAIARRLLPYVRRVVFSLLSSHSDAEDATQAALVEILKSISGFSGRGSLESWSHRIAARVALRRAKKQRALRLVHLEEGSGGEGENIGATIIRLPEEAIPRSLHEYLDELTDVQRTALILRHALGHTVPEIADLTQSPIPTVKSRILKGQQELRRLIRRDLRIGRHKRSNSHD